MADFVDRLRMNSIFPTGNYNPFQFDSGGGSSGGGGFNPDIVRSAINAAAPFLESQQRDEREFQTNMMAKQRRQQLEDVARSIAMQGKAQKEADLKAKTTFGPVVRDPNEMNDYQKAQTELDRQKLAQTGAIAQGKLGVSQQGADINQQKANILAFRAQNPGLREMRTRGGNVGLYDPITGETIDTGVPAGTMTQEGELNLRGEQAWDLQRARQISQRELEGIRSSNAMDRVLAGIQGRKEIEGMPTRNSLTQTPATEAQIGAGYRNRITEIRTQRPDLAPYLIEDAGGNLTVDQNAPPDILNEIGNIIGTPRRQDIQLPNSVPLAPIARPRQPQAPTAIPATRPSARPSRFEVGVE